MLFIINILFIFIGSFNNSNYSIEPVDNQYSINFSANIAQLSRKISFNKKVNSYKKLLTKINFALLFPNRSLELFESQLCEISISEGRDESRTVAQCLAIMNERK